jgi:hypothetical protein
METARGTVEIDVYAEETIDMGRLAGDLPLPVRGLLDHRA